MATQSELEARLAENEERLKESEAEMARAKELAVFHFLTTGWVRQIEAGTVDWDDLIQRLETALETAQRLSGGAR